MSTSHLSPDNAHTFAHGKVRIKAVAQSPSATDTELQVVCFFDQTLNQVYGGGTELVDAGFKGAIRELRSEDIFRGERLETLLLQPQTHQIPARRLLMIGLGDPAQLTLDTLQAVGRIAVREAIKLNVWSFSFAPSLKDAGLSMFEASEVSVALAQGMVRAIAQAETLHARGLDASFLLEEIVFLAGPAHLENSLKGLRAVFAA